MKQVFGGGVLGIGTGHSPAQPTHFVSPTFVARRKGSTARRSIMLSSARAGRLAESGHYLVHCVMNELPAQLRKHIGFGFFESRLRR